MQLQNKNRIAYLASLTLLFSYAEIMLPRFVPFFRLGLGNIAILLALGLPFPDFFILTIIKSVATSMLSGTLISPFFIISLTQSLVSGIVMWGIFKIRKNWISIYGISMIGSAVSALIQIVISTLYLGQETFALLGPMLLFSIAAGLITAFLSQILHIPENTPALKPSTESGNKKLMFFLVTVIFAAVIVTFIINSLPILILLFIAAIVAQQISGRKFLLLPHLSIWLFVIFVNLLSPQGIVLFKWSFINITKDALMQGINQSLKLSIAACLSQCAASLKLPETTITGLALAYFRQLSELYKSQKGNFIKKLQLTLSSSEL